jgi:hypothetical protein
MCFVALKRKSIKPVVARYNPAKKKRSKHSSVVKTHAILSLLDKQRGKQRLGLAIMLNEIIKIISLSLRNLTENDGSDELANHLSRKSRSRSMNRNKVSTGLNLEELVGSMLISLSQNEDSKTSISVLGGPVSLFTATAASGAGKSLTFHVFA